MVREAVPPAGASDFLLDAAETGLALVPAAVVAQTPLSDAPEGGDQGKSKAIDFRQQGGFERWLTFATEGRYAADWTPAHDARLYRLSHWRDEPVPARSGSGRTWPCCSPATRPRPRPAPTSSTT